QHLPPQHVELAPHRAVEDPVSHPHDDAAEDGTVGAEMRAHLLADRPGEPLGDLLRKLVVRRVGQNHAGVHPIELYVQQPMVLLGDLAQQSLAPAPHHRLQKPHELGRGHVAERAREQLALSRFGDARRLEDYADARVVRASRSSYSSRALASSVARSLSAMAFALAISSCASALALAARRRCSSNKRCASARARSASSSCCWMRRSRSSTDLRIAGQPSRQSSPSRIRKTTMVQKISPVLIENGVNAASPPAVASCSRNSRTGIRTT